MGGCRLPSTSTKPLCILFLDLTNLQRLAHITPSNELGADEDADNDVKYWLTLLG